MYSYIVGNFVTDIPEAKDVRSLSLGLSLGFVNVYAEVRLCAHYNLSKWYSAVTEMYDWQVCRNICSVLFLASIYFTRIIYFSIYNYPNTRAKPIVGFYYLVAPSVVHQQHYEAQTKRILLEKSIILAYSTQYDFPQYYQPKEFLRAEIDFTIEFYPTLARNLTTTVDQNRCILFDSCWGKVMIVNMINRNKKKK